MSDRLTTDRLELRRPLASDLDDLVALDADPAVMRYITGGPATPMPEMRDDILPHWLALHAEGRWGFWIAALRDGGAFVGWFHLRPQAARADDGPELGYRLRRQVWGRGLAAEGSRRLVDHAFVDCGADRVWAETMVVNIASRRVMEKVGMEIVRQFHADWPVRIPGDEEGDVEYAIDRARWAAAADTSPGGGVLD